MRIDNPIKIVASLVAIGIGLAILFFRELPFSITAGTTLRLEGISITTPVPASVQTRYEYFDGTGLERRSSRKNKGYKIVLQGTKETIIWLQTALVTNIPSKETNYGQIPGAQRLKSGLRARFGQPDQVTSLNALRDSISVEDGEVWHYRDGSTLIWFYPAESKLKDFVVAKTPSSCPNPEDETCQVLFKAMSSVSVLPKSDY